jgi:hypothetical protein
MLTEKHLRENPLLIKAFMGLPAKVFWQLVADMEAKLPAYELKRLDREDRQRAVGGGQEFDLPLVIRVALVLTYLRLHILQQAVACMDKAATQSDVSRELRRLLPLIKQVLPCPEVWEMVEEGEALSETELLALEQLADGLVLIDATEQQVSVDPIFEACRTDFPVCPALRTGWKACSTINLDPLSLLSWAK